MTPHYSCKHRLSTTGGTVLTGASSVLAAEDAFSSAASRVDHVTQDGRRLALIAASTLTSATDHDRRLVIAAGHVGAAGRGADLRLDRLHYRPEARALASLSFVTASYRHAIRFIGERSGSLRTYVSSLYAPAT